jgi:DNA-binding transcriptional LysR family regulator
MDELSLAGLNLNLLVHLDALLADRSVTQAARRVGVTQSAMSHSLRKLRELTDDDLLVREGRKHVLSKRAEALRPELRRALLDVQRVITSETSFDPLRARRVFRVAAPDFLSVLVLPRLIDVLAREAPGIDLDVVPTQRLRYGWLLETGELDLALGAIMPPGPGIQKIDLFEESFACAVRRGHPDVGRKLDLEAYARLGHLLISIGEDRGPTFVDDQLRLKGLKRRVVARTRSFLAAPMILAQTDLVMTGPRHLLEHLAKDHKLRVLPVPVDLPRYREEVIWHERFANDPAHRWVREQLELIAADLS